ncbi:tyrosine-type recombinase/integrase [Flavobacterium sp. DSR3-2]|uniref:tyrosine-type recombinase/integrase n=1 Tax=Flavobacterium sp. DSR3-2 TaxID=2804634 RepID=UPI003CFA0AD9
MSKLKLPKNPHKGLKVFCKKCNIDNSTCKHYENQIYRVRIHVPGSKNSVKTKKMEATDYYNAVIEAIEFEKELIANNFSIIKNLSEEGNDYSIIDAAIRYNQYLNGESNYAHLKKSISEGYKAELIRYCRYFFENLKKTKDIRTSRIKDIKREDVSNFYLWADKKFEDKTLNKCMSSVKCFFAFLIDIEEIDMRNPFRNYITKQVLKPNIETVNKDEFLKILEAIDIYDPLITLGGKGERKNMFKPYLKDGFRLFLLTGGRREEVVDLRWSNIFIAPTGVKFFRVRNMKVELITNKMYIYKHIPINDDLYNLLLEMGYDKNKDSDNYILCPDRVVKSITIMDCLSKAFTHYRKGSGMEKDISLKSLRKTYLTWVNQVMNKDTKILSSHSTDGVLKEYYLDPTVLTAIEKGALKIKIFG